MATVKMRKGNVVQRVDLSEVGRFLNLGFDQLDENGNVVAKSVPQDLPTMRQAYEQLKTECTELKLAMQYKDKLIEDLKHQLEELKAKKTKKSAKAE